MPPYHQQLQGANILPEGLTAPLHPSGDVNSSQYGKICPKRHLCPHVKCKKFNLCKANFLHLKGQQNIREPLDYTENESTSDIHIGRFWAGHKNTK